MSQDSKKPNSVLVVDDDELLLDLLVMFFEDQNYTVYRASSGNKALEVLKKQKVDVILSDIRMPDGSGPSLLIETRKLYPDPKELVFIFMSGYSDFPNVGQNDLHVAAVLAKPFELDDLVVVINKAFQS
jgi:DNA-binding NtrC family response regulator